MTAVETYRAMVEANEAQGQRISAPTDANQWDRLAPAFRLDPCREMDANLATIAEYVRPDDVVVDVGGGAGRVCLPLALHCREVVNVEPSPGMGREYTESAKEAGISNARLVGEDWLSSAALEGDVVMVFNVTYFVADIVPFIERIVAAARRRVIIGVWSVPPPNHVLTVFQEVFEEEHAPVPGHRQLLPALWEMGFLPDIRVLPVLQMLRGPLTATREDTIKGQLARLRPRNAENAARVLDAKFDALFKQTERGFEPAYRQDAWEMLITWETP